MGDASGPQPKIALQAARPLEGDSLGRTTVFAVPQALRVHVDRHRLKLRDRVLSCTSYVSDGLRAAGQCEVVFTTLDEKEGEGPLQPVLALFAHLLASARQGQRVEAGDVTPFPAPGFPWGQGELRGLVYTHALPLPEVVPPAPPALQAIGVTAEELKAVQAFGASRVLSRLAMFHRYFPCPPWADRRRKTLVSMNAVQPSRLSDQHRLLLRGSVALEGAQLRIRLAEGGAELLRKVFSGLAPTSPPSIALLLQPDPEADACLAWKSTQHAAEGLAAGPDAGKRVAGGFVILEPGGDRVRIVEDGFAVGLGIASWRILHKSAMQLGAAQGPEAPLRWSLEWIPDALPAPAAASEPRAGTVASSAPLVFSGAAALRKKTLLCPEALAARAIKGDRLAEYLATVERAVDSHFSGEATGGAELRLEFELPPSLKVEVRATAEPRLPADLLDDLAARLKAIPSPLVREAGLRLRLDFAIHGGAGGRPAKSPPPAAVASSVRAEPRASAASADFVAGQLAEAEMLVEYGQLDNAVERLGAVLAQHPGHAGARAALARIRGRDKSGSAARTLARDEQASPPARRDTCFAEGDLVGERFRVGRFLAKGGMGEVYEVTDEELGERVALKTIRPEIARDANSLARFKREISLARRIAHPNVCRIFEFGLHRAASAEDTAFLTMELLLGRDLARRLEQGRMSARQALPIVAQMSAALGAAHRMGVVHRDFKSPNVMLIGDDAAPRAVVTDFGLARKGDGSASLTDTGMVVGTPAYMAPEQVEGGEVTAAADIYALGIVIYEMMTGALPFEASTPMAVAIKRLREPPPRPRKLVPDIDPTWEAVILLCLERDPARRFASAEAVAKELGG